MMKNETKTVVGVLNNEEVEVTLSGLATMSKTIRDSVASVSGDQVRFLVDAYYQTQEFRKAVDNQVRSVKQGYDGEGAKVPLSLSWLSQNIKAQEVQIQKMLDVYSSNNPVGRWCKATVGIGPVIASGLIAGFDIKKCHYATQFLSYAGLNDYNNPWLGTAKATSLVNDYLDNHNKKLEDIMYSISSSDLTKKDEKSLKKIADKYNLDIEDMIVGPIFDDTLDISKFLDDENEIKVIVKLYKTGVFDRNTLSDFIMSYRKTCSFTYHMLGEIAALAHRNLRVVLNGITNKETNEVDNSKKALCSYLAKPPYNQGLQTLCWKLGDSFRKQSGRENSLYGKLYRERKAIEIKNNNEGRNAKRAEEELKTKNFSKNTTTYKALSEGKLSDAHLDARARRWVLRLFISHLFEAMYLDYHKSPAPLYYPLAEDPMHNKYIEPEVPFKDYIEF